MDWKVLQTQQLTGGWWLGGGVSGGGGWVRRQQTWSFFSSLFFPSFLFDQTIVFTSEPVSIIGKGQESNGREGGWRGGGSGGGGVRLILMGRRRDGGGKGGRGGYAAPAALLVSSMAVDTCSALAPHHKHPPHTSTPSTLKEPGEEGWGGGVG